MLGDFILAVLVFSALSFVFTGTMYLGTLNPDMDNLMLILRLSSVGIVVSSLMALAYTAGVKNKEIKDE